MARIGGRSAVDILRHSPRQTRLHSGTRMFVLRDGNRNDQRSVPYRTGRRLGSIRFAECAN
jgi:hypothetical protein